MEDNKDGNSIEQDAEPDRMVEEPDSPKNTDVNMQEMSDILGMENFPDTMIAPTESDDVILNTDSTSGTKDGSGEWIEVNGRWWYKHSDGSYTTNDWEYINGKWYYFDSDGWMVTGWQEINGKWYYFWQSTGQMAIGWEHLGNFYYYFNSNGAMITGWKEIGDYWYYFLPENGRMATGWKEIDGKYYYLLPDNGHMVTGWKEINNKWYYFSSSGVMKKGWQYINEKWYYFSSGGAMQTGWISCTFPGYNNDKAYYNYFDSDGVFQTDSDVAGCVHGKNTFNDHYNLSGISLGYHISTNDDTINDRVMLAANRWNNKSNCDVALTKKNSKLLSDISLQEQSLDGGVLAITFYYKNRVSKVDQTQNNWKYCVINYDPSKNVSAATFAHEFGHAMGLTHRITKKTSIMCQTKNGRTAIEPSVDDVNVINHLY